MKFRLVILLLVVLHFSGIARPRPEKDRELKIMEDSLKKIGPAVFTGTNDQKFAANKKFCDLLLKALNYPDAFQFPFDSLKFIANLIAPDKTFRIFNWDIPKDDGTYVYYGYIMTDDSKILKNNAQVKNKFSIFTLDDKSLEIKNPELSVLSPEKWFGALYYQIVPTVDKDKKYYTICGWDGNNSMTWKKVLDAITFGKDGKPIFGEKPIFHRGRRSSNRVIFEFRGELTLTMHWDDKQNAIVFDHLAPEVSGAEGMYQFYSSDGSYDGFEWKKGKWILKEDMNVTNPKNPNDNKYNTPQGDQSPSGNNNGTPQTDPNMKHQKKFFHKKNSGHNPDAAQ